MTKKEIQLIKEASCWIAEYVKLDGMSKEKSQMLFNLSHKLNSIFNSMLD